MSPEHEYSHVFGVSSPADVYVLRHRVGWRNDATQGQENKAANEAAFQGRALAFLGRAQENGRGKNHLSRSKNGSNHKGTLLIYLAESESEQEALLHQITATSLHLGSVSP